MGIECALSPQAEPAPCRASGMAAAGRSESSIASAPQPGGGFASLLQGLGEAVSAAPATTAVTAADASASTTTTPAKSADASLPDQTQTPDVAMQALLVQFLGLAGNPVTPALARAEPGLASGSGPTKPAQPALATTLSGATGKATAAAVLGAAVALPESMGAAAVGHATAVRWQPQAEASAASCTGQTTAAPDTLGLSTSRAALVGDTGSVNTPLAAAWNATQPAQSAATQMPGGPAALVARDTAQESLLLPASDSLTQAAAVTSWVAGLSESELGVTERKRGGAKAEPTGVDVPAVSGAAVNAPGASAGSMSTSAVASSGQGVEQTVAEQVKYWISNDVHNAQLKLDGLGSTPVQVSISMSGNQAQVLFQSDQAQTRAMLGNAMTQLDQMLRGEGLTLTAAWVGSSGQQGQFGAQPQPPQSRQMPSSVAAPPQSIAPAPAAPRSIASTDRAVDLFV